MLGGLFQSSFIGISALASLLVDRALTHRFDRQRPEGGTATTWWHSLVSAALAAALIAQPLCRPEWGLQIGGPLGLTIQLLGVSLAVAAVGLNVWARQHLGRFYAQYAEIQPDHVVVDSGPYAYVRHPIFSAYFLQAIGLFLVVPSWPMGLAMIYALTLFTWTALRDEQLLRDGLPGYTAYMARTARFVPLFRRRSVDSPVH